MVYLNSSVSQVNLIMSIDGGATFGAPVTVGTGPSGTVDQPSIAVGGGSVWVDWNNNGDNNGDMLARRRTGHRAWWLGGVHRAADDPGRHRHLRRHRRWPRRQGYPDLYGSRVDPRSGNDLFQHRRGRLGAGRLRSGVTVTATNVGGYDYIPARVGARSILRPVLFGMRPAVHLITGFIWSTLTRP